MNESIQSFTKEQKALLVRTKKELQNKDESLKKTRNIHEMTKKEYQKLYNEHVNLKKSSSNMMNTINLKKLKKREKKEKILKKKRKN